MVKKLEDSIIDPFKGEQINSTATNERTNGNSYADSLKFDLKNKQQPINNDSPANESTNESTNESSNESSNDFNGNGLLNELVVNVSSNIQQSPKAISNHNKQMNLPKQLVNHFVQPNNTTNNVDVQKRAIQQTKSNNVMQIDCAKKKIRTQIVEPLDQPDQIEVIFFIKNIIEDTLIVEFQDKSLVFKFKTADNSFLRSHNINGDLLKSTYTSTRIVNGTINGTPTVDNKFNQLKPTIDRNKLPLFVYEVKTLFDKIIPKQCSHELSDHHLKIRLRKKISIKWNDLEMKPNEMGTNFLKNVANVQKVDDFAFKYKYKNRTNVIDKLIDDMNEKANKTEQSDCKDEIPVPPPLPKNNLPTKLITDNEPKKEVDERMFNSLLISPLKEEDDYQRPNRKPIPLKFDEDSSPDCKPSSSTSLRLNLADLKGKIGYTGLSNLGNTCYLNSCLQCLSNTVELRDYFLNEAYKDDLNRNNPFGSGGNLAESFSEVLYKLWLGDSTYFSPSRFKRLIDENCSQFIGYSQHDSVEFMEHFLDVLHEDLNRVDRKNIQPATPIENEDQLDDAQLADEQWKRHKERNDSIITKLFYGQYKSKLVCPNCSKVSIVFDPFLYLPIPLTKNKIHYNYYVFPLDNDQPPKRMSVKLPQGSKIVNLLEDVQSKTDIGRYQLIACQINQYGVLEQEFRASSFLPDHQLTKSKKIYVYQKPEDRFINKFIIHQTVPDLNIQSTSGFSVFEKCEYCNRPLSKVDPANVQNCKNCKKVNYCNEKCLKSDSVIHSPRCKNEPTLAGWPSFLFFDVDKITYDELMIKLEQAALKSVEVIETELNEEEEQQQKTNDEDSQQLHVAEEIKEGPLDLEMSDVNENNNDAKQSQEDEEMNDCTQDESTDSLMQNEPTTEEDGSFDKENSSAENGTSSQEDSKYRFILRGKVNDLNLTKQTIYVPKDDSELEQNKFRKSLRDYYYLYIDWKEKFSRIDEDTGARRTFALSIQSRNLSLIAETADKSTGSEQEPKNEITLENLMTKFTEPETLSAQDSWVCPQCKEPRTASKELTIWRPPQILIIQLKRFSYSSYVREKIDKFVSYPVKGLDISKFCTDSKLLDQTHKPIYDLYAVIHHFGGLYGRCKQQTFFL